MACSLPAAVLCDMDGTLARSEDWWFSTEVEVLARYGVTWTEEDVKPIVGSSLAYATQKIVSDFSLPVRAEQLRDELLKGICAIAQKEPTPWQPGAYELLSLCVRENIPTALVTSSYRSFAEPAMKDKPAGSLQVMITGDQPIEGKPSPAPYLAAAEVLGVPIERCLVFEDSIFGVESGIASGASVVHVPYMVDVEPSDRFTSLPTLEGITAEDLEAFLRRGRS